VTFGTDVADFRTSRNFLTGRNQLIGTYWLRNWGGEDQPRVYIPRQPKGMRWYRPPKRAFKRDEHPYNCIIRSSNNPAGSITDHLFLDTYDTGFLAAFGGVTAEYLWTSNDDIALLGKLRGKMAGSDFNAGVSLAEAGQAIGMITGIAGRIDKAWRAAKRGNFAAASQALAGAGTIAKKVARNWLELQYGVKPLLNDVYNAAETMAHFTETPVSNVYSVYRKVPGVLHSDSPPNVLFPDGFCYTSVKIKAIISEINVPSMIGLQDPASVLWEKLPYSFVADWFIPIGNYLAARQLVQSVKGTFVVTRKEEYRSNRPVSANPFRNDMDGNLLEFRDRQLKLTRTVSSTLDVPLPVVKPLSKSATWLHAANAVGLLVNAHGTKRYLTSLIRISPELNICTFQRASYLIGKHYVEHLEYLRL